MRGPLLILLVSLLAASGCGGGDDDAEPTPQERLAEAVAGFTRAVNDQDCAGFARYAHTSVRPPGKGPDDKPDAEECRNLGISYTRLFGFKVTRTKVFGSAAIVEGTVDGPFIVLIWTLEGDRWTQVQAVPGIDPQVRPTEPRPSDEFDKHAAEFVVAQRKGDCRAVFRLLNSGSPFVSRANNPEAFCELYRESQRSPERLAAQLAEAPEAKPVDMGGTRDLHFYRVDTGKGRTWTLILSTLPEALPPAGHVQDSVLDYYVNSKGNGGE